MRKFTAIIAVIVALSAMSFVNSSSSDVKHSIRVVKNPNAGKIFAIQQCTSMNCGGGWSFAMWEAFQYGAYAIQGCTGTFTQDVQPCEPCLPCRRVCSMCPSGQSIIEPATYEEHTITVDKMSINEAKEFGSNLAKDYPDAYNIQVDDQGETLIITFRMFRK